MNFDTSNFSIGLNSHLPGENVTNYMPAFDPCTMLLKKLAQKKKEESGEVPPEVQKYDDADIKELEEFCTRHGIVGFNFGRMNPKAALRMLKGKMGIIEDNTPKSTKQILLG